MVRSHKFILYFLVNMLKATHIHLKVSQEVRNKQKVGHKTTLATFIVNKNSHETCVCQLMENNHKLSFLTRNLIHLIRQNIF